MLPCEVYDSHGEVIDKPIVAFDDETGMVEYQQQTNNPRRFAPQQTICIDADKKIYLVMKNEGEINTITEVYPAPLTWKKI